MTRIADGSKIEWTDYTFNPWWGCSKVSPGCANCYAERLDSRWGYTGQGWGKGKPRRRTSPSNWKDVLKWNRKAEGAEVRPRVFCASMADWLDDEVPIEWLADLLDLIRRTPHLDWLLLTKRPENWLKRLREVYQYIIDVGPGGTSVFPGDEIEWLVNWRLCYKAPANVWIGTSVEDQQRADERIPWLQEIPAAVRFLSVEPMLESIDLAYSCFNLTDSFGQMEGIHWVICGGESGDHARPFKMIWAQELQAQCLRAGVAFFMKQVGANSDLRAVRNSKGGDPAEWPEGLRVRQFPEVKR